MKTVLFIFALTLALLAAGCSDAPQPLASGRVVSGTIWSHPTSSSSNEGNGIPKDARVDVYERLIIIHHADGSKQIAALDHVTDLKLK